MLNWFHQLDRASTVAQVIGVSREYLATWHPEELARLPRECRPGRIKSREDIEDLHACLVDEYRGTRLAGEDLSALQKMTSFIVRASIRMAQLDAEAGEEPAHDDHSQGNAERESLQREQ